ncbi:MAG: O-antigen ligase family protein [Chloroflexi bacterium]|nr:O-antigen ligase family protein [Chloroflexota bacterium]
MNHNIYVMQQPAFFWKALPALILVIAMLTAGVVLPFVPREYAPVVILIPLILAAGVVIMIRPELAMYLSIAYVPFESSLFHPIDLPGSLTVSKLLGVLLIGVFFFNIMFLRRPFRLFDDSQDFAVLLFVVVMLFSAITGFYIPQVGKSVIRMLRLVAFYLAVKNLLHSPTALLTTMWVIVLSVTAASIFGILEFYEAQQVREHNIRVRGVYMDPNEYSAIALIAAVIGIYLLLVMRRRVWRLVLLGCVATLLTGVVMSGSRGGLVSLFTLGLVTIWRQPRRWFWLGLSACILLASLPFWPDTVKDRVLWSELGSGTLVSKSAQDSIARRLSYLSFGRELISEKPWLGVGYGAYAEYYPLSEYARFENPLKDKDRFRVAHNSYLEIASSMGLLGLGAYLLILFTAWRDLRQLRCILPRQRLLWAPANAFELALIGFMFSSAFLSIEHFNYLWIILAVSSSLAYLSQLDAASQPALRPTN